MTLYENLLTIFILLGLAFIGYAKMKKKSMKEVVEEVKEVFGAGVQEVNI